MHVAADRVFEDIGEVGGYVEASLRDEDRVRIRGAAQKEMTSFPPLTSPDGSSVPATL